METLTLTIVGSLPLCEGGRQGQIWNRDIYSKLSTTWRDSIRVPQNKRSARSSRENLNCPNSRSDPVADCFLARSDPVADCFLALPFFAEGSPPFCHISLIAGRVDEGILAAGFHLFVFSFQAEIRTVRSKENVNWQAQ